MQAHPLIHVELARQRDLELRSRRVFRVGSGSKETDTLGQLGLTDLVHLVAYLGPYDVGVFHIVFEFHVDDDQTRAAG